MSHSAKTVSISHLQAAVKTALDAAKKEHPDSKLMHPSPNPPGPVELIYRPWIICGLPVPWPFREFGNQQNINFVNAFTKSLASDPHVAALGAEGKFEAAVYVKGENATIGFVPAGDGLITG